MMGISPLLVGLTVVSVATSAPELAVGITAVVEGKGAMAVGNVAGTNIFNILFILGLSAAIRPLPVHLSSLRLDIPVMIATALLLFVMAWNGTLSRMEGALLVACSIAYMIALVRTSRRESAPVVQEFAQEFSAEALSAGHGWTRGAWNALLFAVGIGLTLLGADLMVEGAVDLAMNFGISESVIGLTIIAIGTSAPELATTVVATIKDERDVAVGNLIGSSITNILVILGITCSISPQGVDVSRDVLWIDLPLSAGVAILCYPVFRSDRMISRAEGITFVSLYAAYMGSLLLLRL